MENNLNEQNFWTVQLLPLRQEDKEKISMCIELQEEVCINKKIFGMGWTDDNGNFLRELFSEFTLYTDNYDKDSRNKISKEKAKEIIEKANKSIEDVNNEINKFNESKKYKKDMKNKLNEINIEIKDNIDVLDFYNKIYDGILGESHGLLNAIKHYKNIKKDDLVIARLKSGKYCIGRVKNNKIICMGKNNEYSEITEIQDNILKNNNASSTGFSWCMSVYRWYIIEEYDIPGHISGRFSGRSAWRTICPVRRDNDEGHMQKLMKIIYYKKEQEDEEFDNDKRLKGEKPEPIPLKIDNISEALSPYELEDLAFLYIMNKHENEGFKLLPSKCKIDEVKYECYIINENNKNRVIAFQVKNKAKIECSIYVDNDIEKIYLYSGKGYTWENKDLSRKEIEEKIKDNSQTDNIEIISNEQLFNVFINSKFFKYQLEKGYYTLLLKDVLEFDKLRKEYPDRRIKLRFNKYKEYDDITYDFVKWYKEDKDSKKFKDSLLTAWSNKQKSIQDNDIIFQFIEVEENKWLLVDVAKILSSNNDNGIAEAETLKEYEKYSGKLTVDFTNSPNQFYYVEPQIIDNIEIFEITNKPYLEERKNI